MRKVLLAVFVGSTALATGALAQSANQTGSQAGGQTASIADCDRVIVFLEQRRVANPPITIEQARVFKRDANAQACRDALNRIEQASAQQPGAQGQQQQQQAGQQNQPDPARIVVQQAQPNVTVQQGQPEIFVRQPQPTITVDIPQPEIVVRMPRPDVNVAMAQPQVQVQQNANQPNVQVQQQAQANVRYERAEPRVVVNQPQGQPTVRFEQPGEGRQAAAEQNQQQRQGTSNQQAAATQQPAGSPPATTGAVNPAGNMLTVGRLTDMDLYGAQGEQLGEIEHVFQGRDGKQYIVIGRGGFLGLGERHVGVPAERVVWRGGRLVVQGMTNDQIKALPTFNRQDQSFRELEDNQQVQISTAG